MGEALSAGPLHPYTRGLLRSIPDVHAVPAASGHRLHAIDGTVPDMARLPPGCRFEPRCSDRLAHCCSAVPALQPHGEGRRVACYLHHDRAADGSRAAGGDHLQGAE